MRIPVVTNADVKVWLSLYSEIREEAWLKDSSQQLRHYFSSHKQFEWLRLFIQQEALFELKSCEKDHEPFPYERFIDFSSRSRAPYNQAKSKKSADTSTEALPSHIHKKIKIGTALNNNSRNDTDLMMLSFLDLRSLLNMSKVNRHYHYQAQKNLLWKPYLRNLGIGSLELEKFAQTNLMTYKDLYLNYFKLPKIEKEPLIELWRLLFLSGKPSCIAYAMSIDICKRKPQELNIFSYLVLLGGKLNGLIYIKNLGADLRDAKAMHWAAQAGDLDSVKYLVEVAKLDPMDLDYYCRRPFDYALMNGHLPIVKYFVKHLGFENKLRESVAFAHNAFLQASHSKSLPLFRYLIETAGVNPYTKDPVTRNTILHKAVSNGSLEMVKYLIEYIKLDPNAVDNFVDTPLMCAVRKDRVEIFQYLMEVTNPDLNTLKSLYQHCKYTGCKKVEPIILQRIRTLGYDSEISLELEEGVGLEALGLGALESDVAELEMEGCKGEVEKNQEANLMDSTQDASSESAGPADTDCAEELITIAEEAIANESASESIAVMSYKFC